MHVTVVSPEQGVFDGSADAIVAPAYDGQVGILPGHAPFLTLLGTGVLQVRHGSASTRFRVAGGFLQVVGRAAGAAGAGGARPSGSWPIESRRLDRSAHRSYRCAALSSDAPFTPPWG